MKKIVILLGVMALGGCEVYNAGWVGAELLCKQNDGVKWVSSGIGLYTATCNNGAVFEGWAVKKND